MDINNRLKKFIHILPIKYDITLCPADWQADFPLGAVFHRLYYIYSGNVVYTDKDSRITLQKKNLYIFPNFKPYLITHDRRDPLFCLWLELKISPDIFNSLINLPVITGSVYYNIVKTIEYIVKNKNQEKELLQNQLQVLFYLLEDEINFDYYTDIRIQDSVEYILANTQEKIAITLLAEKAGLDPAYYSRLFRKITHASPKNFIINSKIHKAVEMISRGCSINTVANSVGYQDVKEFYSIFRRYTARTPTSFYKQQKNLP
ncbi:MAG: hypothetical protein A2096_12850 [Spirochaetes bacterium GWF1_41_5]|nr:MAG: hypothetical protein A2096_12850 [Spirochaetes bacterium GWF1_41_5]HBE04754.1 hypothetical protein [Spirochaetia bacterium]